MIANKKIAPEITKTKPGAIDIVAQVKASVFSRVSIFPPGKGQKVLSNFYIETRNNKLVN